MTRPRVVHIDRIPLLTESAGTIRASYALLLRHDGRAYSASALLEDTPGRYLVVSEVVIARVLSSEPICGEARLLLGDAVAAAVISDQLGRRAVA